MKKINKKEKSKQEVWHVPQLVKLSVNNTKGGRNCCHKENPHWTSYNPPTS